MSGLDGMGYPIQLSDANNVKYEQINEQINIDNMCTILCSACVDFNMIKNNDMKHTHMGYI